MMNNNPVQITREKAVTKIVPVETGEMIHLSEKEVRILDRLADLFEYPAKRPTTAVTDLFEPDDPNAALLSEFDLAVASLSLNELQELYTRTFDLNPVCALEVGYHLFGEDYKRGEFLARLRESQNEYLLGQEAQLPDYLPVLLRMLGQIDDAKLRAELIGFCLLPALDRMAAPFKKAANTYGFLVDFLTVYLKQIAEMSMAVNSEETRYQYV